MAAAGNCTRSSIFTRHYLSYHAWGHSWSLASGPTNEACSYTPLRIKQLGVPVSYGATMCYVNDATINICLLERVL